MRPYRVAYRETYEKCKVAKEARRYYIEIQLSKWYPYKYRLLAHKKFRGHIVVENTSSVAVWAERILERLITARLVKPQQGKGN